MSRDGQSGSRKGTDRGLFERPKGSGLWWVRYADESGWIHREKIGPKALARKVYEKRKTEVQERRFFPERIRRRETLVADYLDQFLKDHVTGHLLNAKHYERYAKVWKQTLRGRTLREVTPSDIARHQSRRRETDGLAPATVNRELAFLKGVYTSAVNDGAAETNPVRSVKFFKENNARVRFLAKDEEDRLRKEIGEEHWPKVAAAQYTGIRRSNLFALRWADVNFDTGVVSVRLSKSGEGYHVPMNAELRGILRALPSRMRSVWVFPSETGETPLSSQNFVNRVFTPAVKRATIPDFHWHDLRRTFASRLAMAGVDLRTLQELMGHKTIAMTLRYAHLSPAHKLAAVECLNPKATGTTTGTGKKQQRAASRAVEKASGLRGVGGGDGWTRTTDLGIMRPSL